MEHLEEICEFLDISARIDLKDIALEYIKGITGSRDGIKLILESQEVVKRLMDLIKDKSDIVKKDVVLSLINISAEEEGATKIITVDSQSFVCSLLNIILDADSKVADGASMLLCNITRAPENLEKCLQEITPKLSQLLEAFCNTKYNKAGCHLNYLGPLFSNLSSSNIVQTWLCEHKEDNHNLGIQRISSFCHYKESVLRRGGAIGTIRNICFDVSRHMWLLDSEIDILPYILLPLMGGEEYPDDEMDSLPLSLQYLPSETQREEDPDIRTLLLESLNRLCAKKQGREYLRKHGVYYVLREFHKWEKERKCLLACENIVDILIRKEEEMECEDITSVEVPKTYTTKFHQYDNDFINDK